jgi:pyruvate/2-oxoglutarate dehydrogenase complex dihydrolipoamide dehydrogenase (E3) component
MRETSVIETPDAPQAPPRTIPLRRIPRVVPEDAHNRVLQQNVHPPTYTNPDPAPRYNLVVIGAGTAGLVTAAGAAGLGARVALVERHFLGGDCLNVGCVPSKCVIRSSRVVGDLREAAAFGIHVPDGVRVDFAAVMERMRKLRARLSHHDSVERFTSLGVDVFLGDGRFTGPDTVQVDGKTLRFKRAVVATGARAVEPPIPGLAETGYLTNETVFDLTERPRRLAVIGGGPIGCELAQAFRRLGSEVVLFHDAGHILNREDADAVEILQKAFVCEGIRLVLDSDIGRVTRQGAEKVLHFRAGREAGEVAVDEILVGAGRAPNVEGLGLDAVGVAYDRTRGVRVDDHLRTTNSRIYAAGDVCMDWKFTHAADFAARIVLQNALFKGRRKLSALTMPWCTYTDPEIAHVGMYERDAAERGIELDTFVVPFGEVDRAIADGEEDGFVKVHVKKGTGRILGATIVARHAGEMIGEVTLAIVAGLGLEALANVIHPYPTQAEAIRKAGDAYDRTRLTPRVKKLFGAWLRWTR